MKKIYGTFGVEMRAYGQKFVKFCTHTDTRVNLSSIDALASVISKLVEVIILVRTEMYMNTNPN